MSPDRPSDDIDRLITPGEIATGEAIEDAAERIRSIRAAKEAVAEAELAKRAEETRQALNLTVTIIILGAVVAIGSCVCSRVSQNNESFPRRAPITAAER